MKYANVFAQGRSGAMRSSRRGMGASLRMMVVVVVLLFGILFAPAAGANQSMTIYLKDSQGVLQDETAYYGYQNGNVFNLSTNVVIGTVPDPNTGIIIDGNGQNIGEVESASSLAEPSGYSAHP